MRSWPVRTLLIVLAAAATACGGAYRDYPRWQITEGATPRTGCVLGHAFVRMSGKTGVGITLQLRSLEDCSIAFHGAVLVFDDGQRVESTLRPDSYLTLRGRSQMYLWLPFVFDNNAAWNDHRRSGTFVIDLQANGQSTTWTMPAVHRDAQWKPEPVTRW